MTRVNGCVRRARPQRDAGYPGAFHELFAVLSGSKLGFATQQPPTTQLVTNYSSSTWKGVVAVPHGPRYNRVSARMTTTPRAGARVEEIVHRHVDTQCSTPPSRRICRAPNILVALRTAQASGSDRSCRRFIPHDRRPRVAGGTERAIRRPHCHHGRRRGIESKPISE